MYLILLSIFFPILSGMFLLIRYRTPLTGDEKTERKTLVTFAGCFLLLTAIFTIATLFTVKESFTLFYLTKTLPITFTIDQTGTLFSLLTVIVILCAGFFSFEYMKHEEREGRYYGFYLLVFGVLNALCLAGNLITFYLFFELLTLSSMPLVLHNGSKEAVMAGLKYLFYSLCGAYAALFGIYFVYRNGTTLTFTAGGVLTPSAMTEQGGFLLLTAFVMVLGFGVKAGMFPMHAWLPTAHPVAPAPASAVLSAVIVKAGVLAIIRTVYYIFGVDFLRGTWMQTAWICLTLITVFMGSMLAYREPVLKKRLAYSTVSQLSYILFGLAVMNGTSLTGSLLHVLAHGFIKAVLFLCAGAIIYSTGKTRVDELRGIGKEMPLTIWCYTIVSLGLIGIPPTGGFISKWYLATGSLKSGLPILDVLGPVILLVSALLTAGYLLPVTIQGFFPGADYDYSKLQKREPAKLMTIPILIMTILSVLIGLFPNPVTDYLTAIVSAVL
ncbi:MAG: proton-conducting membrane transporter [Lachnospiraceae bacterium]|nr:proton-conducting membrane transporter [Lachnospiraceae bacterium]